MKKRLTACLQKRPQEEVRSRLCIFVNLSLSAIDFFTFSLPAFRLSLIFRLVCSLSVIIPKPEEVMSIVDLIAKIFHRISTIYFILWKDLCVLNS
jgi:hypothetical protein